MQQQPKAQPETMGGLLGMIAPNSTPDQWDGLANALMGASAYPTQGMLNSMNAYQRRMADQRKDKKASAQANKTIEALRNAGVPDQDLQIAMNNPAYMRELLGQVAKSRMGQAEAGYKQVRGSDIGMTGENAERMYNLGPDGKITGIGGGGTTTNINMGGDAGEYLYGTDGGVPAGWRVHRQTGEASRIPGGPAAAEAAANEQQAQGRQEQTERAGSTVVQDLQRGLDLIPELGMLSQGEGVVGGISRTTAAGVPGTVANRITQFTESALSNVGLDTLQQMRENSPTGGALGQVPIQQQKRLEQVLGSLDISQPPPVLQANIKRVMNIYTDIMHGTAEERRNAVQNGKLTPEDNQRINSYYYDLPFDERGRAQDDADGVPVYNVETGRWE